MRGGGEAALRGRPADREAARGGGRGRAGRGRGGSGGRRAGAGGRASRGGRGRRVAAEDVGRGCGGAVSATRSTSTSVQLLTALRGTRGARGREDEGEARTRGKGVRACAGRHALGIAQQHHPALPCPLAAGPGARGRGGRGSTDDTRAAGATKGESSSRRGGDRLERRGGAALGAARAVAVAVRCVRSTRSGRGAQSCSFTCWLESRTLSLSTTEVRAGRVREQQYELLRGSQSLSRGRLKGYRRRGRARVPKRERQHGGTKGGNRVLDMRKERRRRDGRAGR